MPNITVTNIDNGSVLFQAEQTVFNSDVVTLGAGITAAAGTILARDTSTKKLVPFVKGGTTNGNGVPSTVLTYAATNESESTADVPVRVPGAAKVYIDRLIIAADGDASNVDTTVIDQLRDFSIIPAESVDLTVLDNQ